MSVFVNYVISKTFVPKTKKIHTKNENMIMDKII